jgi:predicted GNAT family acetyltransferase
MGTLDFRRPKAGVLQIDYVHVQPAARGSGLGRRLVEAAVQWARDEQLTVVPRCSYARSVIQGDPSMTDVLR